jgi:hypothetical protein
MARIDWKKEQERTAKDDAFPSEDSLKGMMPSMRRQVKMEVARTAVLRKIAEILDDFYKHGIDVNTPEE